MEPAEVRTAVHALRDELYDVARELVRRPSVTGQEKDAQLYLADRLSAWGLEVDLWVPERELVASHSAFCDDGLPVERPNMVARWGEDAGQEPAALILNGHIDVVPVGERSQWSRDPFSGDLEGGKLHGRGSCDMKGGLAAASIAVRAAQSLGVTPRRPVFLQSVIGEETGGLGTLSAILRGYRADGAVIVEPTHLHLCPVQSGALSFRLRITGKAAHGAMPHTGTSAIEKFWPIWQALLELGKQRNQRFRHPLYVPTQPAAPLSVGKIQAGSWPSTVPDEAVVEGRFGVLPGEDCRAARRQFEQALREAGEEDPWLRDHPVSVEWFEGQFEPGETPMNASLLRELAACHREVLDVEPVSHGVPYGSDLRLFTRYAEMPAVLYGPGDVGLAHAADEWVSLDELVEAAEVLALLVCRAVG